MSKGRVGYRTLEKSIVKLRTLTKNKWICKQAIDTQLVSQCKGRAPVDTVNPACGPPNCWRD